MSPLSRTIETSSYTQGKIAIYEDCLAAAKRHVLFWASPERGAGGFSTDQRNVMVEDANATIIRCQEKIAFWKNQ